MKKTDYTRSLVKSQTVDTVYSALNEVEKRSYEQHHMVIVLGKANVHSPIIMDMETKNCMDVLLSSREECGVKKENPFFFARPNHSSRYLKHSPILANFFTQLGVSRMKTKNIRKLVATSIQIADFGLTKQQMARKDFKRFKKFVGQKFSPATPNQINLPSVSLTILVE